MMSSFNHNSIRILLTPNWYPTKRNPVVGSFFREQAKVMQNNGYDFKVIRPIISYVGVLNIMSNLYKLYLGKDVLIDSKVLEQNPPAYSISILQNGHLSNWINDKIYNYIVNKTCALILKGWQPDLIHGISFPEGVVLANILSKLLKIPYVAVEHNTFLLNNISAVSMKNVLQAYKEADSVGVVSEHQKKMLLMHQPECNPITLWNLVDESVFIVKKKEPDIFTIATITYPHPVKDYKSFLESMYELSLLTTDFRYIMIGNDSWDDVSKGNTETFENYAKQLGVWELGAFVPHVPREKMSNVLNEVSVFVVTSIAETYGVAAREAMMCGVPVITTACGGIEDAIIPETGVVVPIRAPSKIAASIYQPFSKGNLYDAQTIRQYSIASFGIKTFIQNMKSFYNKALAKK